NFDRLAVRFLGWSEATFSERLSDCSVWLLVSVCMSQLLVSGGWQKRRPVLQATLRPHAAASEATLQCKMGEARFCRAARTWDSYERSSRCDFHQSAPSHQAGG